MAGEELTKKRDYEYMIGGRCGLAALASGALIAYSAFASYYEGLTAFRVVAFAATIGFGLRWLDSRRQIDFIDKRIEEERAARAKD